MSIQTKEKQNVVTIIALLASLFAQMQAISLLGISIPLSLSATGAGVDSIGQVMALYSIGLVLGSYQGKRVIARVGHIRAFSGFAAIATMAAIIHSLTNSVLMFALLRILSGLAAAVMLVVIESWFNSLTINTNRSRLLAIHQIIFYLAMGSGQLLINVVPGQINFAFSIAALLSCLALIPMTLVRIENPTISQVLPISFIELFKIAPCGILGAILAGNAIGTVFNLSPIYAQQMGTSTLNISIFMSAIIFSGVLLQRPIGKLADKYPREYILCLLLGLTLIASLLVPEFSSTLPLPVLGIMVGAPIACLYPVSVATAYANLPSNKAVASSSALLLAYAIGGFSGPILTSFAMASFGSQALFYYLALSCLLGMAATIFFAFGSKLGLLFKKKPHIK
ncbi:MFS transporter [Thalassotalea fonticola]|uniref:MFS transporter n=1 Tax=Thalassotalea fonticola TaxID=3065649 RepID=A0ABZ0GK63_9GAMM|nr:MFS transporter [Colwelliaceae bacterium S1-1]